MRRVLLAALLVAFGAPAFAGPSVFVRNSGGSSWWSTKMDARILGKAAGPITADALSAYLAETMIYSPYKVCALEAVQPDTFVGLDRVTQTEMSATIKNATWRIEAVAPSGRRLVAQSVVFEACDADDPRGAALLITDAATNQILRWQWQGDRTEESGASYPSWVLFLYPRSGDELFSYSDCSECGARTNVYYDVTRKAIYTEYNGH